jgi:hypothetical protein
MEWKFIKQEMMPYGDLTTYQVSKSEVKTRIIDGRSIRYVDVINPFNIKVREATIIETLTNGDVIVQDYYSRGD